jgi:acyl-CoA thioesterase-2
MEPTLADLVNVLELERLEINIFRGVSRDIGSPQVFGGQVLGQALRAAYGTVESDRSAHSMHAYFLRRGDVNAPIVYFVDRSRDGHSFASRRVTAIQHGEQIFHMAASFQTTQPGLEHQTAMPDVPMPEELEETSLVSQVRLDALPEKARQFFTFAKPFEFRVVPHAQPSAHDAQPVQSFWIRAVDRLPDDEVLHRCLLAYVSDFHLLNSATLSHGPELKGRKCVMASIDHAMWFHRTLRVDEWFLCSNTSPSASGSRGFARGSVYARDGLLAATTAQEGLIRIVEPTPPNPDKGA